MEIDIPGRPEDYFTTLDVDTYKANRALLRSVVAIRNLKLQEVIAAGGNPHQASLDLNDQFDNFLSSIPIDAKTEIYETYAEELNASASEMFDEADRINSKAAAAEENNAIIGQIIAVVVVIAIAAVFITNM